MEKLAGKEEDWCGGWLLGFTKPLSIASADFLSRKKRKNPAIAPVSTS